MKKIRLKVHIDGIWYRVHHGKLHKISGSGSGFGVSSQLSHRIDGAFKRDASTQVSLESCMGDNMKSHTTMFSTNKNICRNSTTKSVSLSNTLDWQEAEIRRRRKGLKQGGITASGGRESHTKNLQIAPDIDRACPFVGGSRPKSEPSHEIGDAHHVYDSDESCMSTAASAKKSLIIKLRISKVKAQHLLGVNP